MTLNVVARFSSSVVSKIKVDSSEAYKYSPLIVTLPSFCIILV